MVAENKDLEKRIAKLEFMVKWRNNKIKLLEDEVKGYEHIYELCAAIISSVFDINGSDCVKVSKERIEKALKKKYIIKEDDENYYFVSEED